MATAAEDTCSIACSIAAEEPPPAAAPGDSGCGNKSRTEYGTGFSVAVPVWVFFWTIALGLRRGRYL